MFEESEAEQSRRITELQARARAEATRRAMLDLLRDGPRSSAGLRAKLGGDASITVVNYHLAVLLNDRAVVREGDLYRLA